MGSVGGSWRIRYIILLFILLTSVYVLNGMFYDVDTTVEGYIVEETALEYDDTNTAIDKGNDFMSILFGIGDYLTFGNIDNTYARILINIFVTCAWIIIGYLLYTFVSQNIPLT